MGKVYGIDLGTTYSCIASIDKYGRPIVYTNADNQATTPSVVMFSTATDVVVGVQAKRSSRVRPDDVVSLVKREMGNPDWRFRAHGEDRSAPLISSQVLASLVRDVERSNGESVTDVVITVPAYTGMEFRQATMLAGELAGLNVVDIINEPTAAAISYGFLQEGGAGQTILVYDLGGGTFDVTVIRLGDQQIEEIATAGNQNLGGANWDERIATYLGSRFVEQCPEAGDPWDDSFGTQDLLNVAEELKQSLSNRDSYEAMIVHNGGRASVRMTKDEMEGLTADLLQLTMDLTAEAVAAAEAKGVARIDQVLLVGGMSKSPAVSQRLTEMFTFEPRVADPDLAVAKGAAIFGQKRELESYVLESLRRQGRLTPEQTLEDARRSDYDAAIDQAAAERDMNPAEVADLVATQITNVTSRGFGIWIKDGDDYRVEFLAHAQDQLPIKVEQRFFTLYDNQTAVDVRVLEQNTPTESIRPDDNVVIVAGTISGIPPRYPRNTPVDITLEMGTDQVILVTARHEAVPEPLVLTIKVGTGSAEMRAAEQAKADRLRQRA